MDGFCTLVTTELSHVVVHPSAGQLAAAICSYNHVQNKQYLILFIFALCLCLGNSGCYFFNIQGTRILIASKFIRLTICCPKADPLRKFHNTSSVTF